jgi:hypothetical protein
MSLEQRFLCEDIELAHSKVEKDGAPSARSSSRTPKLSQRASTKFLSIDELSAIRATSQKLGTVPNLAGVRSLCQRPSVSNVHPK